MTILQFKYYCDIICVAVDDTKVARGLAPSDRDITGLLMKIKEGELIQTGTGRSGKVVA